MLRACSLCARSMPSNCPNAKLVGDTLANEFNKRQFHPKLSPEMQGTCKDGDFAAGVVWAIDQVTTRTNSIGFVVNCQSCSHSDAQYQGALVTINLVYTPNTLSKGLSIRSLPGTSSSTSLSYNSLLLQGTL